MITIFTTGTRLMTLKYQRQYQKYNKEYFMNTFFDALNASCNQHRGEKVTKHMFIQMDNCKVHNAEEASINSRGMKMTRL
jgi:hypothetical protein